MENDKINELINQYQLSQYGLQALIEKNKPEPEWDKRWDTQQEIADRQLFIRSILYGDTPVVYSPQHYFIPAIKNEFTVFGKPVFKPNYKLFKRILCKKR